MQNIKDIKKDQWIFTCSMKPLRFDSFESNNDPNPYTLRGETYTDDQWWKYTHDGFITMEGSSHFVDNCGCKLISEKYAKWFLENECWKLFPENVESIKKWEIYENIYGK